MAQAKRMAELMCCYALQNKLPGRAQKIPVVPKSPRIIAIKCYIRFPYAAIDAGIPACVCQRGLRSISKGFEGYERIPVGRWSTCRIGVYGGGPN